MFEDLSSPAGRPHCLGTERTMGATAAAKALYALRPRAVMPWDQTIADDSTAVGRSLRRPPASRPGLGRQLLGDTGWDEPRLAAELGQPGASLARLLDQYCYVRFTLKDPATG